MNSQLEQTGQINSNKSVRFPKPKLIVADKTSFLNELKECESSLFCIATKKKTLETLQTIVGREQTEVWQYNSRNVENFIINSQELPDFSQLRNNKITAYLDLTTLNYKKPTSLNSLFFNLVLKQLKGSENINTVYLFIDELNSIGPIVSLEREIQIIRTYNIGLVMATSALDRLARLYGPENVGVIIANGFDGFRFLQDCASNIHLDLKKVSAINALSNHHFDQKNKQKHGFKPTAQTALR
jgi:hypothetical protein